MVQWFDPPLQTKVKHRPGDTVIAVPAKSGTTWTMNIFCALLPARIARAAQLALLCT